MNPTPDKAQSPLEASLESLANSILSASCYPPVRTVRCELRDGELVLSGRLPSYYHKQVAQGLVTRLEGVATIRNCIEVGGEPLRLSRSSAESCPAEVIPK